MQKHILIPLPNNMNINTTIHLFEQTTGQIMYKQKNKNSIYICVKIENPTQEIIDDITNNNFSLYTDENNTLHVTHQPHKPKFIHKK